MPQVQRHLLLLGLEPELLVEADVVLRTIQDKFIATQLAGDGLQLFNDPEQISVHPNLNILSAKASTSQRIQHNNVLNVSALVRISPHQIAGKRTRPVPLVNFLSTNKDPVATILC